MNNPQYNEALKVAETLTRRTDDTLFEELGLRIRDMQNVGGFERSQQFSAEFAQDADDMFSTADLMEVGRRWWHKLEPQIMSLVCKDSEIKQLTSGKTPAQVAAALATAGLLSVVAPPAWVIVASSILAAKIAETGLDSLCEVWQESLTKKTMTAAQSTR
jgi:hypothetical protein